MLTNCLCLRCHKKWFSTKLARTGVLPDTCVRCKSPYWNREKIKRIKMR